MLRKAWRSGRDGDDYHSYDEDGRRRVEMSIFVVAT